LRRVLQKKIEDPIAEEILTGHYKHNDTIKLALHEDMIVFSRIEATNDENASNEENTVQEPENE